MQIANESDAVEQLRFLIDKIKKETDQPPNSMYAGINDPVAQYLGINILEKDLGSDNDGHYRPRNSNLGLEPTIEVNSLVTSKERVNFTYFHEVCHHIIREDDSLYSFLNDFAQDGEFSIAIEKLCNIGAAEFIIPKSQVVSAVGSHGFTVQLIQTLDERFSASLPATCIQLAQCASHPCLVVLCQFGSVNLSLDMQVSFATLPQQRGPCLHVLLSSPSPSFKYAAGKYIPVPHNHILMDAFESRRFVKGRDIFLFKNGKGWPVDCEAFYYRGRVFGIFNQKPPVQPSKNQLSLFDLTM